MSLGITGEADLPPTVLITDHSTARKALDPPKQRNFYIIYSFNTIFIFTLNVVGRVVAKVGGCVALLAG